VRLPALWLLLLALFAASSCGGGDEAQPLTLEQRVVAAEDAPGWKDDPVEQGQQTTDLGEFITALHELAVDADPGTTTDLFREAGFQGAIFDVRFFGETHTQDAPHIFSSAVQLGSEDGTRSALEWLEADSKKPCPRTCALRVSEFDVDGIPDARGIHRSQSAEDIERLGQKDDRPFDSYAVLWSDGPFVYSVDVDGPPGSVSEEKAEEIATALHHRVEGAPPAE
jgi:hypothetical protein